jgi:hypothetical protein
LPCATFRLSTRGFVAPGRNILLAREKQRMESVQLRNGDFMPTLEEVYQKFGEAAEAAQLIETELGTLLLFASGVDAGLLTAPNPAKASDLYDKINRHTFGKLIQSLNRTTEAIDTVYFELLVARDERNRLFHSFYRQHNFRRNSDEGRAVILNDLESIHDKLIHAYKALSLLSGIDLDALTELNLPLPTGHLKF